MLTAQDERPQPVGRQGAPVAWNIARDYDSQGEKVRETQHIKIGLVDGIDRLDHPLRNQRFEKALCQVITMKSAKRIHARDMTSAARDWIRNQILAAPPKAHHAPRKNINCHA